MVLGLVTTKSPVARKEGRPASAASRRPASLVDLDRLAISPQCGFASVVEGNLITVDDEIAKLRMVVDVAEDVWGRT